jgi:hypothetical protein
VRFIEGPPDRLGRQNLLLLAVFPPKPCGEDYAHGDEEQEEQKVEQRHIAPTGGVGGRALYADHPDAGRQLLELGGRDEGRAGQIHNEVRAVDGRKLRDAADLSRRV